MPKKRTKSQGIDFKLDLTGHRFGKLEVLSEEDPNACYSYRRWKCLCDCGAVVVSGSYNLLRGLSKSCGISGCGRFNKINLQGKRFGKLSVEKRAPKNPQVKNQQVSWLCKCDCGNDKIVTSHRLLKGISTHCGCENIKYKDRSIPPKHAIYALYQYRSKKKNIEFSLSYEEAVILMESDCFYCGSPPTNIRISNSRYRTLGKWKYNGIDRIDNKKGYVYNNCVSCCFTCNSAKSDDHLEEFVDWGIKLGINLENKHAGKI